MWFIGDIHGLFYEYKTLIAKMNESIQLGDFGIGFPKIHQMDKEDTHALYTWCQVPTQHRFIRGNHDNPLVCKDSLNYLGDFGIYKNIFYISGAWSIDQEWRTPGVSWWEGEQLSPKECYDCYDKYIECKPEIVVSHECPLSLVSMMGFNPPYPSRTNQLLEMMFKAHQPKWWLFGHFHQSWDKIILGTHFKCLNSLEIFELKL